MEANEAISGQSSNPTLFGRESTSEDYPHREQRSGLDSEVRHISPENRRTYAAIHKCLELRMLDLTREGVERDVFDVHGIEEAMQKLLECSSPFPLVSAGRSLPCRSPTVTSRSAHRGLYVGA